MRTKSTLGITWDDAAFTGGVEIQDYRVWIAEAGQTATVLAQNVYAKAYIAIGLTAGVTYELQI